VLDNLTKRGLKRPQFLIVDGAPGLDKAIAAVWDGVRLDRKATSISLLVGLGACAPMGQKVLLLAIKNIMKNG
jgi:hypothetical protein